MWFYIMIIERIEFLDKRNTIVSAQIITEQTGKNVTFTKNIHNIKKAVKKT